REFGYNPREYATHPVPLYLFTPYGVKFKALTKEGLTMENVKTVFVQMIEKPQRKVLIKRGINADDYLTYCEEVGCDVWGLLTSMRSISGEPVCLWLPDKYIAPGTSKYVQGVEMAADYDGIIPDGFDVIELPPAKYLMFQGEPFAEEDYDKAIQQVWDAIKKYDPSVIGYAWDMENPRIQLEPRGARGYIELVAIK
ncbi:MAG: AraC family transcriptional regulator, partial [Syntrophomonadaceae bacterium]|nr:AraC family transcriptional regulator [Syntrophomonadaceae bacterium]